MRTTYRTGLHRLFGAFCQMVPVFLLGFGYLERFCFLCLDQSCSAIALAAPFIIKVFQFEEHLCFLLCEKQSNIHFLH